MEENIDLTKILENCPKGWKFYSSVYGDVEFIEILHTISVPYLPRKDRYLPINKIYNHGDIAEYGISR